MTEQEKQEELRILEILEDCEGKFGPFMTSLRTRCGRQLSDAQRRYINNSNAYEDE